MGGASTEADHARDGKIRVTYEEIHETIGEAANRIKAEFNPDLMIAIGGGGFFPARVARTFLKTGSNNRNIPIQAIGLALYEQIGEDNGDGLANEEQIGKEVVRTQWLDFSTLGKTQLLGRRILIVDEVDDTRTTLIYAVAELRKDIDAQLAKLPESQRASHKTDLAILVVHNKLKEKNGALPEDVKYYSGLDIEDKWVAYPWECQNIGLHNKLAAEQVELGLGMSQYARKQ